MLDEETQPRLRSEFILQCFNRDNVKGQEVKAVERMQVVVTMTVVSSTLKYID